MIESSRKHPCGERQRIKWNKAGPTTATMIIAKKKGGKKQRGGGPGLSGVVLSCAELLTRLDGSRERLPS